MNKLQDIEIIQVANGFKVRVRIPNTPEMRARAYVYSEDIVVFNTALALSIWLSEYYTHEIKFNGEKIIKKAVNNDQI